MYALFELLLPGIALGFVFCLLLIIYLFHRSKKKKGDYVPGADLMDWSILETELLENLNIYRAKHDFNVVIADRILRDFANYCARRISTDSQFMKEDLPQDILDTLESFPFNEFVVMFEDANSLDNITQVGKALKCRSSYRKALLSNKFKYIGIGVDSTVNDVYYYCVILAR